MNFRRTIANKANNNEVFIQWISYLKNYAEDL